MAQGSVTLDPTWQVGIGWGIVIILLTVGGVWLGVAWAAQGSSMATAPLVLGVLGWVAFLGWLEKGVTK